MSGERAISVAEYDLENFIQLDVILILLRINPRKEILNRLNKMTLSSKSGIPRYGSSYGYQSSMTPGNWTKTYYAKDSSYSSSFISYKLYRINYIS